MTRSLHATEELLAEAARYEPEELDYLPSRTDCLIALTSVPSRLPYLKAVLGNLLRQTLPGVAIELHLPVRARSTGEVWPDVGWLAALKAVRVVWHDEDPGPALKFLGPLAKHAGDVDPLIVVVDDDVLYPPELVAALMRWSTPSALQGRRVYCLRGWQIHPSLSWERSLLLTARPDAELPVGVITGHGGYAVRPSLLRDSGVTGVRQAPPACRMMDDVWISGCLSRAGVSKFLVDAPRRHRIKVKSAIGGDRAVRNDLALRYFADTWRPVDMIPDHEPRDGLEPHGSNGRSS